MKILVIHATAGAGHKVAAQAIFEGLQKTGHDAVCVDALDYTNPLFKWSYPRTYSGMVTKAPWLWQFFFGVLDVPALQDTIRFGRRLYNGLNARPLERYLIDEQFDWIICTQFLSVEVSGRLKRQGKIAAKIMCVVTDFDVHRIWINPDVDYYTGACDFTKEKLISLGVPRGRALVTGIPIFERFRKAHDTASLKKSLGLQSERMTVLIATGSFGMGPIEELIDALPGVQVAVICGHNKALYTRLQAKRSDLVHVFGLVQNMDEMMAVSDVMVTKPGGLSISEALVSALPMVFFSAIPGQETNNVNVLRHYNIGLSGLSITEIAVIIQEWNAHPQKLEDAKQKTRALAKPHAVDDIVAAVEGH